MANLFAMKYLNLESVLMDKQFSHDEQNGGHSFLNYKVSRSYNVTVINNAK